MSTETTLAAGKAALQAGRWADAVTAFEELLKAGETAEVLLGLGDAFWWLGECRRSVAYQERAYAEFRRSGEQIGAAMAAINLCFTHHADLGNGAAASGWAARAERVLEGVAPNPLLGWVLLARAEVDTSELMRSRELARRALEIARDSSDRDLELCALSCLGEKLVAMGQVREGFALVDEAMAATFGGEYQRLETVVFTSCSMMTACELAADIGRVTQWSRAADGFVRTYGSPYLRARCRIGYGTVLASTGRWDDADRELRIALEVTRDGWTAMHGRALERLAVLRLHQGRLEEAESLLADIGDDRSRLLPAAMIELAHGRPAVATALLQRRIHLLPADAYIESAEALELLVEAHLADGDLTGADAVADSIQAIARQHGHDLLLARAAYASGRVLVTSGQLDAGIGQLEEALDRFSRHQLPWEAARTRLELARALTETQPEVAVTEGRRALAAFENLGATADADAAASLLRSLGVAGRTGPKHIGVLSEREQEVLGLVGHGLSNPEIAERLFISRKTAAHHVSNILAKLGLRNRAEAVAYAATHLIQRQA